MTFRFALVAVAVAGLSAPTVARDAPARPERAANPAAGAPVADDAAASRPTRGRSRMASRSRDILPPPKPDGLGPPAQAAGPSSPFDIFSSLRTQPVAPDAAPIPSTSWFGSLLGEVPAQARGERLPPLAGRAQIDALVSHHARLNGVPEALVHRVIVRESKYNPRAVGSGGAMGLMQIKTPTARGLGYAGGPMGLLDAETNLTYAVKYLAGAYRVADGNFDQAVMNYARGYYYAAKRKGMIQTASRGERARRGRTSQQEAAPQVSSSPAAPSTFSLFRPAAAPTVAAEDRSAR